MEKGIVLICGYNKAGLCFHRCCFGLFNESVCFEVTRL